MTQRVLILNENLEVGRYSISRYLRNRGAEIEVVSLADIAFDTTSPTGLNIPAFGNILPDAVFVRSIHSGSFEAITRRLGVLHALTKLNVPVWNSAQAIERCVDKSMTSFLLHEAGLKTPATFAIEGEEAARALATRELTKGPLVLKPLFGAQGYGIRMIHHADDLPSPEAINEVYYLQHYVARSGPPFHDYRIFVCAGEAIAMMRRSSDDWITNVNRGATPTLVDGIEAEHLGALAIAAADAVGACFAGVDILQDETGAFQILEVNSMPAWSGLQTVAQINVADRIAESLLASLPPAHQLDADRCSGQVLRTALA